MAKNPGARRTAAVRGRIGGVAVALGVGGAVATGLAAQAAAAPADSSTARASSSTASVGRGVSAGRPAASRPAAARTTKGSATPPVARRSAVRSAATVAATSQVTLRPAPAVGAPAGAAPVRRPAAAIAAATATATAHTVIPTGAAVTPSDIWSSLMTRLAGIFGWDPRGRLQTIYKATNFTIPNNVGFFIQKVAGSATFTPNTTYDLGDADQFDWNKLTGIAFTPLEPDRDSAMVGWRYNLQTQMFEIAPFYNVNKVRILPNENPLSPGYEVIAVPADQAFTYTVDYTGVTISYGDRTVFKPYPEGLTPNVWTAARVSGWFGGNESAPRTVSYYLKLD